MKEWTKECNAFNTWKILFHVDKLRQIAEGKFPVPVTVDVDPSNSCNQKCVYCNSKIYRQDVKYGNMPSGHLKKISDFLSEWGVTSTCIGGGGEPLMNNELRSFIPRLSRYGIESGVITNGSKMDAEYVKLFVENCRFVGISFDAATRGTYERIRGADHYDQVVRNMRYLNQMKEMINPKLDTNIKFLIHPWNWNEIRDAARLAKDLGFSGIHMRPVAIDNVPGVENPIKGQDYFSMKRYIEGINEQIDKAFELDDESFSVFAVHHKFGKNMQKVIRFKKCRATPLQAVFQADGKLCICFNMRGRYILCDHYPDPSEVKRQWGSRSHKDLIDKIDPINECIRCTYNRYNQVIEQAIIEDRMFYKFP